MTLAPSTVCGHDVRQMLALYPCSACALEAMPAEERELQVWLDTPLGDIPDPERKRTRKTAEEADPEAKRRMAEALAWVAAYRGTWGLPLDIRADPKWGTKYMRLSDRQVEVLLAAKARDAERSQAAADWATITPGAPEAMGYIIDHAEGNEFFTSLLGSFTRFGRLTDNQLAAVLRQMPATAPTAAPDSPQPVAATSVTDGMYRVGEVIYKVQRAVHGSKQLYAKRLTVDGDRGTFEYEQGAIRRLRPEHRMTVEEAAAFGKLYGVCCVCGRTLTDETSIERGIGPICAEKV